MFPSNEAEIIVLYKLVQRRLGWRIVHQQTQFPDLIIENGDGAQLLAEAEHLACNFKFHGHDPKGCDLIICWQNNWPHAPLPVWAMEDCAKEEAQIIGELLDPVSRATMDELHHYLTIMHRDRLRLEGAIFNLQVWIDRLMEVSK